MKKLLLSALMLTGAYAQSHAMMGRHAQRVRTLKQLKRACSTQTTATSKRGFFRRLLINPFTGFLAGASIVHTLYEKHVGDMTNKYGKLECPYKSMRNKINDAINKRQTEEELNKINNEISETQSDYREDV